MFGPGGGVKDWAAHGACGVLWAKMQQVAYYSRISDGNMAAL
jgi:hypothetical protein